MTTPTIPRAVFGRPGVVLPPGTYARLRPIDATTIAFESSYDALLVADFKNTVPPAARRWDKPFKRWLVDRSYAPMCATLIEQYFGLKIPVPTLIGGTPAHAPTEQRLLKIEYLGRCKERQAGTKATATGFADGDWSVIFPESVLRAWFEPTGQAEEAPATKGKPSTLYAVLMVTQAATTDELKAAYRRLARQWHPDACREPDAAERFMTIKDAYDVLSDESQRRRYDVGLTFQMEAEKTDPYLGHSDEWRTNYAAPLRCGWVLMSGRSRLGVFVAEQILGWEDVVREDGKTMVSSWKAGAQSFTVEWV